MNRAEAKHLSIILDAFIQGREIERQNPKDGRWYNLFDKDDFFLCGSPFSYRIKAEYRPYESLEEFARDLILNHDNKQKIKLKDYDYEYQIRSMSYYGLELQKLPDKENCSFSYNELKNKFLWSDTGTPVGIKI